MKVTGCLPEARKRGGATTEKQEVESGTVHTPSLPHLSFPACDCKMRITLALLRSQDRRENLKRCDIGKCITGTVQVVVGVSYPCGAEKTLDRGPGAKVAFISFLGEVRGGDISQAQ